MEILPPERPPAQLPAPKKADAVVPAEDAVFKDTSPKSDLTSKFLRAAGDFARGLGHNALKKPAFTFLGLPFVTASTGFMGWMCKEYMPDRMVDMEGKLALGAVTAAAFGMVYFFLGAQYTTGKFIREHRVMGSDGKWKLPEHTFKPSGGREGMVEWSDNTWGEAHAFSGREIAQNLKYRLLPLLKQDLKPYRAMGSAMYQEAKEQAFVFYKGVVSQHYGDYLKPETIDRVFDFLDRELKPPKDFGTAVSFPKQDHK